MQLECYDVVSEHFRDKNITDKKMHNLHHLNVKLNVVAQDPQ